MAKKSVQPTKPTGVNKGIKEGIDPEEFQGRVICKKCGKDIEFTLGSELFLKCPRCKNKVERDLKTEQKEAKKIIKYDILRRSKKYILHFGFLLTIGAIAYNLVGFLTEWFSSGYWWLGLMSLPFVVLSSICTFITRKKSASKLYKMFAWVVWGLNLAALALIIVTSIPQLNEMLMEAYRNLAS